MPEIASHQIPTQLATAPVKQRMHAGTPGRLRRCARVAGSRWAFRELYSPAPGFVSFTLTAARLAGSGLPRRRSVGPRPRSLGMTPALRPQRPSARSVDALPLWGSGHGAATVFLPQKSILDLGVDLVQPLLCAIGFVAINPHLSL